MRRTPGILVAVLALVAALVATVPAQAASERVTKSEAKKALRTLVTIENPGVIVPFEGSPWDGAHFCGADWHTVKVPVVEGGDASFTKQDAAVILDAISVAFTLDGSPLASERTKIKSVPDPSRFGAVNAYFFNQGRVLSPDELSVGQHELSMRFTDSSGTFDETITFFIDAAGTGACL